MKQQFFLQYLCLEQKKFVIFLFFFFLLEWQEQQNKRKLRDRGIAYTLIRSAKMISIQRSGLIARWSMARFIFLTLKMCSRTILANQSMRMLIVFSFLNAFGMISVDDCWFVSLNQENRNLVTFLGRIYDNEHACKKFKVYHINIHHFVENHNYDCCFSDSYK